MTTAWAAEVTAWRYGLPYEARCPRCGEPAIVHHSGPRHVVGDHYDQAAARRSDSGRRPRIAMVPCDGSGLALHVPVWTPPPGLEPQYELGDGF